MVTLKCVTNQMELTTLSRRTRSTYSIRTCLLVGVNVPLILASVLFLALDYRSTLSRRIADKRVALKEEATVLLSAVEMSEGVDLPGVQQLIDLACGRMQDAASPGHHIVVQTESQTLQASAHHRASRQYFEAMQRAAGRPNGQAEFDGEMLVVGVAAEAGIVVYVSEFVANVIQSIRMQLLMRLTGGVLITLLILAVINFILTRTVVGPLQHMSAMVRRIGGGELGAQVRTPPGDELQLVAESINDMSRALADAEQRRSAQMRKARRIQQNLRPSPVHFSGMDIAYLSKSADDVGGDFVDFVQGDGGTAILCVADVTGHGVPAAMGAAMIKVLFDAATRHQTDPSRVLTAINTAFHRVALEGDFATATVITLGANRRWCHYASAGHEPVVLLHADGACDLLNSTGLVLGIEPGAMAAVEHHSLQPGDRLVVYTDGLVEAVSHEGEQFGRDRLVELLVRHRHESANALCKQVMTAIEAHVADGEQLDDMTLLVIEVPADKTEALSNAAAALSGSTV